MKTSSWCVAISLEMTFISSRRVSNRSVDDLSLPNKRSAGACIRMHTCTHTHARARNSHKTRNGEKEEEEGNKEKRGVSCTQRSEQDLLA